MSEIQHYILFPNHDNAMRLYRELKKLGVRAVIAPTPRSASKCCGVSLMVERTIWIRYGRLQNRRRLRF